jgi:hypothetical protein
LKVTLAPAARFGTVNCRFTTEIVRIDVEPAAALPPFLMTIVFFVNEATYRSGARRRWRRRWRDDRPAEARRLPTLRRCTSRPRTAKECAPTPSDWYEAGWRTRVGRRVERALEGDVGLARREREVRTVVVEAGGSR